MISVVISTLGTDPYVRDAILSTLDALGAGGELVLHLDGCKTVPSSIARISDTRFTVLITEEKVGFSQGLNLCIESSKHDSIGRMDADDLCIAGRWSLQQRQLENTDVTSGIPIHYFPHRKLLRYLPHYFLKLSDEEIKAILPFGNPIIHPAAAFRREVFNKIGGYGDALAEDYEFWLRASLCEFKMTRTRDYVVQYRHHKSQASRGSGWALKVLADENIRSLQSQLRAKTESEIGHPIKVLEKHARTSLLLAWEFRSALANARSEKI